MSAIEITLGYMEAPLTEQLRGIVLPNEAERYEMDNKAINRLAVRGFLSEGQLNGARQKLMKQIRASARALPNAELRNTQP